MILHDIKLAKKSLILMGNSTLKLLTQITIIVILSKKISIEKYGIYQSVWMYINIISVCTLFGLPSLILSSQQGSLKIFIKENIIKLILISAILNFFIILYLLVLKDSISLEIKLLLYFFTLLQNISIVLDTQIIKREKEYFLLISNFIFNIIYFGIHLFFIFYGFSISKLLAYISIVYFLKNLIQLFFLSRNKPSDNNNLGHEISIGSQWFYLGVTDIVGVIFKWIDKWVILIFISLKEFAIYFNASYEIPIYAIMVGSVGNIMLVELAKAKTSIETKTKEIFEKSINLLSRFVFPSFCFLVFFHSEIFKLLFGDKYIAGLPIFFITLFLIPIRVTNFTAFLQVYGKADIILKGSTLDLLIAILLMLILYPSSGLKGIALACVLSTYIQAAYYLWHTSKFTDQKIMNFIPFKAMFFIMFVSAITMGLVYFVTKTYFGDITLILGFIATCILITIWVIQYGLKIKKVSTSLVS